MRETKLLPSISNVKAGLTAVLNCPLGKTYDHIVLAYTGTSITLDMFKNINVKVNGKPIQTFKDGLELQSINNYYQRGSTNGYLTLWFNRPELREVSDQRLTSLGTLDIQTLSVEFDVDSSASADLAVTAWAKLSEPTPLAYIGKVKAFPMSSAVAGEIEIDNIVRGARIAAIHVFKSDVEKVELTLDSVKIYEAKKALGEVMQKQANRVPATASCTHIDFLEEGDISQALITAGAQDLRLKPTLTTAGSVRVVVEYLDGLAGI
jgi:hypothetical protein